MTRELSAEGRNGLILLVSWHKNGQDLGAQLFFFSGRNRDDALLYLLSILSESTPAGPICILDRAYSCLDCLIILGWNYPMLMVGLGYPWMSCCFIPWPN